MSEKKTNAYQVSVNGTYLPEMAPFITTKFREEIELETGHSFRCRGEEFPVKMPADQLYQLIFEAIKESVGCEDDDIRRLDLNKDVSEISVNSPLAGRCVLKIFTALNVEGDEDYYYEEDTSICGEALIANIEIAGIEKFVEEFAVAFRRELKKIHDESRTSMIRWIFTDGHGSRERTFQIKKDWDIDRQFYPWIEAELKDYYKAFIESRSQILVAFGPPGTGKTSFIRDLICEMNLNAYISYDLKVLTSDSTFVRYLTDTIFDAIIIEDADELLTSERGEYNKVIAKILNVSDGLIKLPQKKLIFTTNLPKVEDIDPAIIRPGRCFDVLEFRPLTFNEAKVVADKLKVELPKRKEGHKFSLAEIFYEREIRNSTDPFTLRNAEKLKKRKIGFVD